MSKNVPLLSHEETSKRLEGGDLERENTPSYNEEADRTEIKKLQEVVQSCD